jgi:phosphatidylserine decarboxylase
MALTERRRIEETVAAWLPIKIAREGWPFIAIPGAIALALLLRGRKWSAAPFAVVSLASAGFFRDPDRTTPEVANGVLSAADGYVVGIAQADDPFVGEAIRVSVFLSPLDVHVNRAPIGGTVVDRQYTPGQFQAAYRPEASEVNERCTLLIQGDDTRVVVVQIAGVLARRIVCRVAPGDTLEAGQRFGMIKFGSRTDLLVPRSTEILVHEGDYVRGGETVIGVLR